MPAVFRLGANKEHRPVFSVVNPQMISFTSDKLQKCPESIVGVVASIGVGGNREDSMNP